MLNNFCVKEISNAHLTATLFHSLLETGEKSEKKADEEKEEKLDAGDTGTEAEKNVVE